MQSDSTIGDNGSIFGVLEAADALRSVAAEVAGDAVTFLIYRNGFWFEKSGCSMAVYNTKPRRYVNGRAPEWDGYSPSSLPHPYFPRVDLKDGSQHAFLAAIDAFLLERYVEAA